MRPVPTCNGLEDKSLSAEVTSDIAVGARISFNICGEVRRGRGLLFLHATTAAKLLPPLVTPSPSALGKDRRDTTHAIHLAVNITPPVRLSHAPASRWTELRCGQWSACFCPMVAIYSRQSDTAYCVHVLHCRSGRIVPLDHYNYTVSVSTTKVAYLHLSSGVQAYKREPRIEK